MNFQRVGWSLWPLSAATFALVALGAGAGVSCGELTVTAIGGRDSGGRLEDPALASAADFIAEGRRAFRSDTFGDEAFWSGALKLHLAIEGHALGGVGPGLSPEAAFALGLKVDGEALSPQLKEKIRMGSPTLKDPAITLELLGENAVVGLHGSFNPDRTLKSVGVTCALCHSTVDDALGPNVGRRLDGWPNRDLDVGAILALAPDLTVLSNLLERDEEALKEIFLAWGPGKFDATLALDGKATRPDGKSGATLIPPAFGLAGVNLTTWTGWGSVTHWNGMVANLEMHGQGTFYDPRLDDPDRFPIAAKHGFGSVRNDPDLVTPKLAALHVYQLLLRAPQPPAGTFDAEAAERGKALFEDQAQCSSCHVPPLFTEPGWNLHSAQEIGVDDFQSIRSPDERYRTTPLKGLFVRQKGGYYHDGRFPNLDAVVEHYDRHFGLELSASEKRDLVEYLRSL